MNTLKKLKHLSKFYPKLAKDFSNYLKQYLIASEDKYYNTKIYGQLETKDIYVQAIIDYISGMTDRYAVSTFNELIKY